MKLYPNCSETCWRLKNLKESDKLKIIKALGNEDEDDFFGVCSDYTEYSPFSIAKTMMGIIEDFKKESEETLNKKDIHLKVEITGGNGDAEDTIYEAFEIALNKCFRRYKNETEKLEKIK